MHDSEQLLGFDVREIWSQMDDTWPQNRKDTFLLRTDVKRVLSVDTHVWPQMLKVERSVRAPAQYRDLGFWENLHQLQEYLQQNKDVIQQPYQVIAITLLRDALSVVDQPIWDALLATTVPELLDEGWTFIGYDIADEGFISGLSNCGYKAGELQALRDHWTPYLNEWHLFTEQEQAIEFREMSDQRIKVHALFYVYALYSIANS